MRAQIDIGTPRPPRRRAFRRTGEGAVPTAGRLWDEMSDRGRSTAEGSAAGSGTAPEFVGVSAARVRRVLAGRMQAVA
jgi:hypothetical protein